jgi:hypothetical protein
MRRDEGKWSALKEIAGVDKYYAARVRGSH